jgi:thiamine transporter
MKKTQILALTEAGIMVALSAVLSLFKLLELPYGGSVTFASMLPIIIFAYRHGIKWGISAALTTSVIQLLLGLKYFSYFTTWQSIVALAVFDYIIAFAVFGLAPVFKKRLPYRAGIFASALLPSVLRYVCHVISGATVWAGLSIPTEAALVYSIGYNATYMIPETIVLVTAAVYISSALDFSHTVPTRARTQEASAYLPKTVGALAVVGAVIYDTVAIFEVMQDAETGDFIFTNLHSANWLAIGIVSALGVAAFLLLNAYAKKKAN